MKTQVVSLLILALIFTSTTSAVSEETPDTKVTSLPPTNQRILKYAVAQIGKTVGDGECWTFGAEALKDAKAKHPDTRIWGRALDPKDAILPGDVIQFDGARFQHKGTWVGFGTHTAIVAEVKAPGVVVILHQNFSGVREVNSLQLDLGTKTKGEYVVYRPLSQKGAE